MQTTTNYKLKKPDGSDTVNIEDLNYNADIIDIELKKANDKANNISVPVKSVNSQTGYVVLKADDIKCNDGNSIESHMDDMKKEIETIDLSANKVKLNKITGMNATEVQAAIQELFQFADNGKKSVSDVIGSPLSATDTFSSMQSKIQTLKGSLSSALNSCGKSTSSSYSLSALINNVKGLQVVQTHGDNSVRLKSNGAFGSGVVEEVFVSLNFTPSYVSGTVDAYTSSGKFSFSSSTPGTNGSSKGHMVEVILKSNGFTLKCTNYYDTSYTFHIEWKAIG